MRLEAANVKLRDELGGRDQASLEMNLEGEIVLLRDAHGGRDQAMLEMR
jgi:hypothetical protein